MSDRLMIDALCNKLERAMDLPIRLDRCPSGAHMRGDTCGCTGLPRLGALVDLLLRSIAPAPSTTRAPGGGPTEEEKAEVREYAGMDAAVAATRSLGADSACGADDHPVFTYPCMLPKGHAGPHNNGSGDPWESKP